MRLFEVCPNKNSSRALPTITLFKNCEVPHACKELRYLAIEGTEYERKGSMTFRQGAEELGFMKLTSLNKGTPLHKFQIDGSYLSAVSIRSSTALNNQASPSMLLDYYLLN